MLCPSTVVTESLKEKAKQNFAGVKSAATRGEGCSCLEGAPAFGSVGSVYRASCAGGL